MTPGTKVVGVQHWTRTVDGAEYEIECVTWNDTTLRSFDVYNADGELLTEDESFDDEPTDAEIRRVADPEPPCGDPRPDPRTHPEYWTE